MRGFFIFCGGYFADDPYTWFNWVSVTAQIPPVFCGGDAFKFYPVVPIFRHA